MADIITTRIFTDGEKGITATKLNDIVASSTIQPAFVSTKPTASTADPADTMLLLKAAGTYAQVPFSTVVSSVNTQLPSSDSEIWSVRSRSFSSLGNGNFEVDSRNIGGTLTNPANAISLCDRWALNKTALTATFNTQCQSTTPIVIPGTTLPITRGRLAITLTAQQTTLAPGDFMYINQYVEGPQWRELSSDVHSISLLVNSSVAGLKFSVSLRDNPVTKSLVKLCTIPTAGVWTLITLPNIPAFPAGNFATTPGVVGYTFTICPTCGPNFTAPAADTWQAGNFVGAPGMSNYAGQAVNSTFYVAAVQHEPGSVCSNLMDKNFQQNYEECLRYYQKSYRYNVKAGSGDLLGAFATTALASQHLYAPVRLIKPMAKVPTIIAYSDVTGTATTVRDTFSAGDRAVSAYLNVGDSGFGGCALATVNASPSVYTFHWTADTGW